MHPWPVCPPRGSIDLANRSYGLTLLGGRGWDLGGVDPGRLFHWSTNNDTQKLSRYARYVLTSKYCMCPLLNLLPSSLIRVLVPLSVCIDRVFSILKVKCLSLDRTRFFQLLGPIHTILQNNMRLRILKGVPLLSKLTNEELCRVADAL